MSSRGAAVGAADDDIDEQSAGSSLLSGQRSRSAVVPTRAFPDDPDTGASARSSVGSSSGSGSGSGGRIPGLTLLLALVMVVVTLAESARGVVIPTLTLFNESLGGTQFFLSFLIGLFSVGRLIASVAFGSLLDRTPLPTRSPNDTPKSEFRPALALTLVVVILGHTLYLAAASVRWLFLIAISRALTGFGTGVLAVARVVVAQWTSPAQRVQYMSVLSFMQYVGFAITPVIGAVAVDFTLFGGWVHIDIFTFGSLLLLAITLGVFALFVGYWYAYPLPTDDAPVAASPRRAPARTAVPDAAADAAEAADAKASEVVSAMASALAVGEAPVPAPTTAVLASDAGDKRVVSISVSGGGSDDVEKASIASSASASASSGPIPVFSVFGWKLPGANTGTLWFLVVLNTVCRGTLSVAETYGAQVYMHVHAHGLPTAALTGAALEAQTSDTSRFFLFIGLIGAFGYLATALVSRRLGEVATLKLGLAMLMVGFALLIDFDGLGGWRMGSGRLWAGMILMWSLGQSLVQTVVMSLFSKALQVNPTTRKAQGTWTGFITAAGSVGRIVFPLVSGLLIGWIERGGVFVFVAIVHTLCYIAALQQTDAMQVVV